MDNCKYWDALRTPPKGALKTIQYGNLKGKSDINPQWRMQAMTEVFGVCGVGWKYEVTDKYTFTGIDDTTAVFVEVNLYICVDGKWSEPIPGTGGSMLGVKDKNGYHINDEAYKMATTDALSVAMKQIGVAADIYMGIMDGSKYETPRNANSGQSQTTSPQDVANIHEEAYDLFDKMKDGLTPEWRQWCADELSKGNAQQVIEQLNKVAK